MIRFDAIRTLGRSPERPARWYERVGGRGVFRRNTTDLLLSGGIILIVLLFSGASCGPEIEKFVVPKAVCVDDSIVATWTVKGEPTMSILIDERGSSPGERADEMRSVWLTLVARKGGDEVVRREQVRLIPHQSVDSVTFEATIKDDTLIASGVKDTSRWGNRFFVTGVEPGFERPILVLHEGHSAILSYGKPTSHAFDATRLAGRWEFRSALTDLERMNPEDAPDELKIRIYIRCGAAPPWEN